MHWQAMRWVVPAAWHVALLLAATSCSGRIQADRGNTSAARRAAHDETAKTHNEAMDKAGAPENETDGKARRVGATNPVPAKP
jgi:hypothetical protein